MATGCRRRARFWVLGWPVRILALWCAVECEPVTVNAQGAPQDPSAEEAAPALRLDRVREVGQAILVARAKARREQEAKIRPVLEALGELRDALREYATEDFVTVELPAEGDPQADAKRAARERRRKERRAASWQAAKEALLRLQERRQAVVRGQRGETPTRRNQAEAAEDSSDERDPIFVRPEGLGGVEAAAAAFLSKPQTDAPDTQQVEQLQQLLLRLEVPTPRPAGYEERPTVVYRDAVPVPNAGEGQ